MVIHIFQMYKSKHPHMWDDNLCYVQHNYNKSIHYFISHNPFQVGLGFQPRKILGVKFRPILMG